jgi:hypothetical protein
MTSPGAGRAPLPPGIGNSPRDLDFLRAARQRRAAPAQKAPTPLRFFAGGGAGARGHAAC